LAQADEILPKKARLDNIT